jgi:hypothetical protein
MAGERRASHGLDSVARFTSVVVAYQLADKSAEWAEANEKSSRPRVRLGSPCRAGRPRLCRYVRLSRFTFTNS